MQRRFADAGIIYDYELFRSVFRGVFAPGVYRGFDITISSAGDVVLGSLHDPDSPGLYVLPSGIAVTEDESIILPFTLPGGSQNYTIRSFHTDNGFVGGTAATYGIVAGELSEQPANGAILGWIRYDGTGSLTLAMITPAPKLRGDEIDQVTEARASVEGNPPRPILSLASGASEETGVEAGTPAIAWHGVQNAVTVGSITSYGYFQWRVLAEPYKIVLRVSIPSSAILEVSVIDTAGVTVAGPTAIATTTFSSEHELLVPAGIGTWDEDGVGTVLLTYQNGQGTTIKIGRLLVDNWPFAIPRT